MDPLDIHGSIHGSMDVDVTNIHGYPSSDFTACHQGQVEIFTR
jgi:hypothetical protein